MKEVVDGEVRYYVCCVNCSWHGTVERTDDDCPNCEKSGMLMWAEDKPNLPDQPEV